MQLKCVWNILSSGVGTRFGNYPKQYYIFKGKTILEHTLDNITEINGLLDDVAIEMYVVSNDKKFDLNYISGGSTRIESIYNAINYHHANDTQYDLMFFHDAVRPNLNIQMIRDLTDCDTNAELMLIPVSKLVDSVIDKTGNPVKRDNLLSTHTPEVFTKRAIHLLRNSYQENELSTSLFNIGLLLKIPYKFVQNCEHNFKITYKQDIQKLINIYEQNINYSEDLIKPRIDTKYFDSPKNILILGGTSGIGKELDADLRRNVSNNIYSYGSDNPIESDDFFLNLPNLKWDIIIHSVGTLVNLIKKTDEITMNDYTISYKIHYESIIRLVKFLVKTQNTHQIKLILLGSSSSIIGTKNMSAYSPFKAAISRLGEIVNCEYDYIFCNVVHPARTNTKLRKQIYADEDKSILMSTSILAKLIISIIQTDIQGQNIFIDKYNEIEYLKSNGSSTGDFIPAIY